MTIEEAMESLWDLHASFKDKPDFAREARRILEHVRAGECSQIADYAQVHANMVRLRAERIKRSAGAVESRTVAENVGE